MKVSMFTKEEMHADQAEFRLLVLISKYARDPWRRSLTSQTDSEANGEWGVFSPSFSPQRKCHANVRPWDAQSCRPRCFPFTPSGEIAVEGSFILGDSNWKLFQVGYPVDTHTDMNFLLRVSVTHRPAFARLILGRWKERSLRMKPPSLPIDDSTPVSQSRHTLRFQPIACRSIMRCPRVLTKPEMVWQAFVPDIASGQLAVFDMAENNNRKTELLLWPV